MSLDSTREGITGDVQEKHSLLRMSWECLQLFLLGILVVVVVAVILVPKAIGAVPLTILSGSMEPSVNPGDIVVVQPVDSPSDIGIGDVITFQPKSDDPSLVTHRVTTTTAGADADNTFYVTRGDANGADDDPIRYAQVKGKVVYSVPFVGWITPSGYGKVIIPAALSSIAVLWVVQVIASRSQNRKSR